MNIMMYNSTVFLLSGCLSYLFLLFSELQFEVRVPGVLPSRVKFIGLQLCEVLTFFGSSCCDIPFKIHIAAKVTSLGENLVSMFA